MWKPILFLLLLTACQIEPEMEQCPYTARLEYWYTGSGGTTVNILPNYIYTLNEFIFDSEGILRQVFTRRARKGVAAELDLPPGKYTLVTWANADSLSLLSGAELNVSRLPELLLYPDNGVTRSLSPWQENTNRLYYGYATFTIGEHGVTRQRIDMTHSHLRLGVTIKWKGSAPQDSGNLIMTLSNVPAGYRFMPEFEIKGVSYDSYRADNEEGTSREGIYYYIPMKPDNYPLLNYRRGVQMDITRQVRTDFITHRLKDDTHPVLCLYDGSKALIKEVDLYKYFRTMQIDLDRNLGQEFDIVVEVNEDGSIQVFAAVVSDWIDGGTVGGGGF